MASRYSTSSASERTGGTATIGAPPSPGTILGGGTRRGRRLLFRSFFCFFETEPLREVLRRDDDDDRFEVELEDCRARSAAASIAPSTFSPPNSGGSGAVIGAADSS